ncbi:MAG: hypothetical protein ACLP52_22730, partial [Streptosporangiaceae bacterium]
MAAPVEVSEDPAVADAAPLRGEQLDSAASTALAPTGRSTAAQMVRVATSTAATSPGRPITPSSITAITSSGVPSIWTCSPGRAAIVAVNTPPGRPAV